MVENSEEGGGEGHVEDQGYSTLDQAAVDQQQGAELGIDIFIYIGLNFYLHDQQHLHSNIGVGGGGLAWWPSGLQIVLTNHSMSVHLLRVDRFLLHTSEILLTGALITITPRHPANLTLFVKL